MEMVIILTALVVVLIAAVALISDYRTQRTREVQGAEDNHIFR